MTPDPVNLPALSALADEATPGPWTAVRPGDVPSVLVSTTDYLRDVAHTHATFREGAPTNADAAFIAASRSAIPVMIEALTEAREAAESARWRAATAFGYAGVNGAHHAGPNSAEVLDLIETELAGALARLDAAVTWEAE